MGRMAHSWDTVKASWGVLRKDKELLLFPVFSAIASAIIAASFIAPTWFSGLLDRAVNEEQNAQIIVFAVYFVMYLVLTFVTVYFTSALIFAATERLEGGDPNIGSGLRGANKRIGRILAWSLFAGTVSFLIKILESATRRGRGAGALVANILVRIVGVAWTLATYFAIPIVVFEDRGVWDSLKRSGQLFKQRWGESVVGEYGISFVFGLLTILSILALVFLAYVIVPVLGIVGIVTLLAVGVVWILLLAVVGTALGAVYKAALYRFATKGQVSSEFPPQMIEGAFRSREVSASRARW